jgi:hypothetical protein
VTPRRAGTPRPQDSDDGHIRAEYEYTLTIDQGRGPSNVLAWNYGQRRQEAIDAAEKYCSNHDPDKPFSDRWHTVAVTADGPLVLTRRQGRIADRRSQTEDLSANLRSAI